MAFFPSLITRDAHGLCSTEKGVLDFVFTLLKTRPNPSNVDFIPKTVAPLASRCFVTSDLAVWNVFASPTTSGPC